MIPGYAAPKASRASRACAFKCVCLLVVEGVDSMPDRQTCWLVERTFIEPAGISHTPRHGRESEPSSQLKNQALRRVRGAVVSAALGTQFLCVSFEIALPSDMSRSNGTFANCSIRLTEIRWLNR